MATLIAHLVIGERLSAQMQLLRSSAPVYGAFLLGCLLVDANHYSALMRRQTHFVTLSRSEGSIAPEGSCAAFLQGLDSLLLKPWGRLNEPERAFVAGYLCHLAADEAWLDVSRALLQEIGLQSWHDLPVPSEAMLVMFNLLSQDLFEDFPVVKSTLKAGVIPNVFSHVPHTALQRTWHVARPYVLAGGSLASYLTLLATRGKSRTEIESMGQDVRRCRGDAAALIEQAGGVERFLGPAVERAAHLVPRLWAGSLIPNTGGC
jgi:hypothetical protein